MLRGSDFSPHPRTSPRPNTSGFPGKAASFPTPPSQRSFAATPNPCSKHRFCSASENKEGNDTTNNSSSKKELCLSKEPKSILHSSRGAGRCRTRHRSSTAKIPALISGIPSSLPSILLHRRSLRSLFVYSLIPFSCPQIPQHF